MAPAPSRSMHDLNDKTAVITGGTTGIGLATAQLFHARGARVLVTGRNEATIAEARRVLPGDVAVVRSDASRVEEIDLLVKDVADRWGKLDILFLNAGTARVAMLSDATETLFDDLFALNVKGPFFALQRMRPVLAPESSVILNTSIVAHRALAGTAIYAATKAALRALVRTLATELASSRIRLNAVCPGLIETPIFGKIGLPPPALDALAGQIVGRTPASRTGTPDEVARAVAFFASKDSSFVVGEELVIDGGYLAT
jgi:NAD(P)-dependent dehydrogenase (short-subunit alcohol dehydrogenase family)